MALSLSLFLTKVGQTTGRFLSDFTYVLSSLVFYLGLCVITYVWVKIKIPSERAGAFFLTYEIATGADPLNFAAAVQNDFILWRWILVLHSLSWLIVPVLTGTAITAAFHVWEERKLDLHDRLFEKMVTILTDSGVSAEDAGKLAKRAKDEMSTDARRRAVPKKYLGKDS